MTSCIWVRIMTIKEHFGIQTPKNRLQYLRFAEYNFWLFQYSARKYRIEIMQGNEFDETNGKIIKKHNKDAWDRVRKYIVGCYTDAELANKVFTQWMERGNYVKNKWVRRSIAIKRLKLYIKCVVSVYDAHYSSANNLFYLPLSKIEQTLIGRYSSLPVDIQAEAKFLADLSHTYGDYFYQYADWFPMDNLLRFFENNHLSSLEKNRDLLLGKTVDNDTTKIIISEARSLDRLEWIDRRIQKLKRSDAHFKEKLDGVDSFYKHHLSSFIEKGYAWYPLLEENSEILHFAGSAIEDLSIEDFLPTFLAPPVLQFRNDNLSEDKENISQNLVVDRCPFPRGYRTNDEIESLRGKYNNNDLLVCIWIKPDRDKWSDGEKLAKKICSIINKEIKDKDRNTGRKERIIFEEAERCLVAKNVSNWDSYTTSNLIFIVKFSEENYNKSLTDKSIHLLCKIYFTMYFGKAFHPSDGAEIFYQAHSHASKTFKEFQVGRFLGLWVWDQIELKGKSIAETVRKAIEINKIIFNSWKHSGEDSPERHIKSYLEQTRLCVKSGKVLPLAR